MADTSSGVIVMSPPKGWRQTMVPSGYIQWSGRIKYSSGGVESGGSDDEEEEGDDDQVTSLSADVEDESSCSEAE